MGSNKERLSTPPKMQKKLSGSLSKDGELVHDNDDVRKEDVYNFIKKAAALKNESSSSIIKGVSEFSKAIADVYSQSKNNILHNDAGEPELVAKSSPHRPNEHLEKIDKPLYYNFGL